LRGVGIEIRDELKCLPRLAALKDARVHRKLSQLDEIGDLAALDVAAVEERPVVSAEDIRYSRRQPFERAAGFRRRCAALLLATLRAGGSRDQ